MSTRTANSHHYAVSFILLD